MKSMIDLVSEINPRMNLSVSYGQSRKAIKNALGKELVAYGIGLAGFVAIYEDGNHQPRGVGFSSKLAHGNQPDSSFYDLKPEEALEIIENSPLVAKKEINRERLEKLKENQRPTIAKIKIKTSKVWFAKKHFLYVRKYKNGSFFIEKEQYNAGYYKLDVKSIAEKLQEGKIIEEEIKKPKEYQEFRKILTAQML